MKTRKAILRTSVLISHLFATAFGTDLAETANADASRTLEPSSQQGSPKDTQSQCACTGKNLTPSLQKTTFLTRFLHSAASLATAEPRIRRRAAPVRDHMNAWAQSETLCSSCGTARSRSSTTIADKRDITVTGARRAVARQQLWMPAAVSVGNRKVYVATARLVPTSGQLHHLLLILSVVPGRHFRQSGLPALGGEAFLEDQ